MEFNDNASLDSGSVLGPGSAPGGGGGGKIAVGGIGGIIILLISLFLGINPGDIMGGDSGRQQAPSQQQADDPMAKCKTGADIKNNRECRFTAYSTSVNNYWAGALQGYQKSHVQLFQGSTTTGCGSATSEVGPFYCPADKIVWLDTGFFDELQQKFGAQGGDAAEFYVLAHEYGHHIQNLVGTMDKVQQAGQQSGPTSPSVRLELQADCYGGAALRHSTDDPNGPIKSLTQDDLNRAIDAAQAVGDDRIQQRMAGRVDRESWTHGSSANRKYWLAVGFNSGDPNKCTTFAQDAPQIG